MTPTTLSWIIVGISVAAWALFMGYVALRPARHPDALGIPLPDERAEAARPVEGAPDYVRELDVPEPLPKPRRFDEDVVGVTRRQFLNRAWVGAVVVGLAQFGAASLDFLYPRLRGGFGTKITVGEAEQLRNQIGSSRTPIFISDGRFWLALFEGDTEDAEKVPAYQTANVAGTGFMALFRKCVHLGCSVPWCPPAKWFECPCHGSKYSINGEYRDGPAPRSLDLFRTELRGAALVVDTSLIIEGAPRGTTTGQPQPEGIHCIDI